MPRLSVLGQGTDAQADAVVGSVVEGRYRIVGLLGEGGMGRVYRAEQLRLNRPVAIKILSPNTLGNANAVLRFEQEAQIIAQLSHPNTIKLFDCGRLQDGRLFLVTELLEGRPLSDILTGRALGAKRVHRLLTQVCESLREAHDLGIIHRDLKPGNIFVQQIGGEEVFRVLDFGLARVKDLPSLTLPNQVFGTPGYMPPEQVTGERIDARSDIYSLGCVGFEGLAGERVYPVLSGESPFQYALRCASTAPVPLHLRSACTGTPREMLEVVTRMVERDPAQRPPSVHAVLDMLARLVRSSFDFESQATERGLRNQLTERITQPDLPAVARSEPPSMRFGEETSTDPYARANEFEGLAALTERASAPTFIGDASWSAMAPPPLNSRGDEEAVPETVIEPTRVRSDVEVLSLGPVVSVPAPRVVGEPIASRSGEHALPDSVRRVPVKERQRQSHEPARLDPKHPANAGTADATDQTRASEAPSPEPLSPPAEQGPPSIRLDWTVANIPAAKAPQELGRPTGSAKLLWVGISIGLVGAMLIWYLRHL
ncbi:MAG: protein kinase [Deltaproteobacteria bacterium]|nr:protein kinase [Deltaproteobacteria bacterium]